MSHRRETVALDAGSLYVRAHVCGHVESWVNGKKLHFLRRRDSKIVIEKRTRITDRRRWTECTVINIGWRRVSRSFSRSHY